MMTTWKREFFMANGSYLFCDVLEWDMEAPKVRAVTPDGREFEAAQMYGTWGEVRSWDRPQTVDLFDVIAVNIRTRERRTLAERKTEADADAIVKMAVMRLGVGDEFFKVVPRGGNRGIESGI